MLEKISLGNAIEGESYTGKTTALETIKNIEKIRERGIIIVPEYGVIGSLPNFPRNDAEDIRKSVEQIIGLEKKRTDIVAAALARNSQDSVLFDRGPISCIAFEHAAEKNGYTGAALWLAEAFQREVEDKNIIVPKGMVHFTADRGVIRDREASDIASGHGRIMDFLRDEEVAKALNEAFAAFGKFLPEQLFLTLDTGNKNPDEIGAEVLQFIKGQTEEGPENTPDFIQYAHSLLKIKK